MEKNKVIDLGIKGCWTVKLRPFSDNRGSFHEWFQGETLIDKNGAEFKIAQANCSISHKGVIRGIHFAKNPPGQAKYVTCISGKILDVVVDLRKKSPTFGKWTSVVLDSTQPSAIYVPSGIGHSFMALEDDSIVVYLCDQKYNPDNEFDISPFDKTLNIEWPVEFSLILSEKDSNANSFESLLDFYPEF